MLSIMRSAVDLAIGVTSTLSTLMESIFTTMMPAWNNLFSLPPEELALLWICCMNGHLVFFTIVQGDNSLKYVIGIIFHYFSFTALAESYIDFHLGNIEDLEVSKETREALCEKRLSEGWFLYALIEIKTRYLIEGT